MLPDSPWYWLVSRPGIRLAHPYFTLSVVEGGKVGSGLGACVSLCTLLGAASVRAERCGVG